ncbi:MAG: tRNA (adenosine(37)-N6)-threonylcarbamoyltransferase complex dimerization subunit type 1 TsaB [Thermoactinomyces sp.]
MKLLSMDTSTLVMGVAVFDLETRKVLGEITTNLHINHSVRLMPTIDRLLRDLDLKVDEITHLAVSAGPGSYTGVRIGVTTAKTIAWARHIPLYSESSLAVLAMNGVRFDGLVVPMFDARRHRVYTGAFCFEQERIQETFPQQVIAVDLWLEQLANTNQPVLFLGDDVSRFQEEIQAALGKNAFFGTPAENIPRPAALAWLACQKWSRQEPPEHKDFAPNYLQLTEAESNWLKKQRKEGMNG